MLEKKILYSRRKLLPIMCDETLRPIVPAPFHFLMLRFPIHSVLVPRSFVTLMLLGPCTPRHSSQHETTFGLSLSNFKSGRIQWNISKMWLLHSPCDHCSLVLEHGDICIPQPEKNSKLRDSHMYSEALRSLRNAITALPLKCNSTAEAFFHELHFQIVYMYVLTYCV